MNSSGSRTKTRESRLGLLLAPAVLLLGASLAFACSEASRRPNVILISIDTLRADHLGTYGYPKDTSPVLDDFSAGATVFENAIAQAPHTIPSVLQLMTSRYAQGKRISDDSPALAEMMAAAGYQTAAVVDNANFETNRVAHGLRRGFDHFYRNGLLDRSSNEMQHWKTKTPADAITAQTIRYLKRQELKQPFFLWLHYFDPHDPYLPPFADNMEALSWRAKSEYTGDIRDTFLYDPRRRPVDESFSEKDRSHLLDLYDAEIRYCDQSLGELFEFLEDRDLFDSSLVIVTSDHGESFGEHRIWTHGRSLYEPEIHVPLIVKRPRQRTGERVAAPAQVIDIVPTILEVTKVESDAVLDGNSLLDDRRGPAFAFWRDWTVVRTDRWKLVRQGDRVRLFDIRKDPGELRDVAAEEPATARRLAEAAAAKILGLEQSRQELEELSEEALQTMRALGYLN